ncbi:MAG: hypothetical protein K8L91_32660 [Anaerolineae bacterium]|nr:hypothetical protein [Anaerolineae bacterium]
MKGKWLVRLYPKQWRKRYEVEFLATLEQMRLTPLQILDVVFGAMDAHLKQFRNTAYQKWISLNNVNIAGILGLTTFVLMIIFPMVGHSINQEIATWIYLTSPAPIFLTAVYALHVYIKPDLPAPQKIPFALTTFSILIVVSATLITERGIPHIHQGLLLNTMLASAGFWIAFKHIQFGIYSRVEPLPTAVIRLGIISGLGAGVMALGAVLGGLVPSVNMVLLPRSLGMSVLLIWGVSLAAWVVWFLGWAIGVKTPKEHLA